MMFGSLAKFARSRFRRVDYLSRQRSLIVIFSSVQRGSHRSRREHDGARRQTRQERDGICLIQFEPVRINASIILSAA